MTWPLGPSLDDLLNSGPDPADSPAPDLSLLDEVIEAVHALTEKLRAEPELRRAEALQFVKEQMPSQSIHFMSLLWPQARLLAHLPIHGKRGRPRGSASKKRAHKTNVHISRGPARLVAAR